MTGRAKRRLQNLCTVLREKICNRNATASVLVTIVDANSPTWIRLMRACWWRLRFAMMTLPPLNWFAGFIQLSQKWSAPIDRDELLRRIFAR
jgi:hypothetical protein